MKLSDAHSKKEWKQHKKRKYILIFGRTADEIMTLTKMSGPNPWNL